MDNIQISNAKIHNLKGFDITIPKNKLIAVTGVSGSGKSSLVFDILHGAGQKFYLEALGMYCDDGSDYDSYDLIKGLNPTIAVQQRTSENRNSRSVVGTVTKIFNMLSIIYLYDGKMDNLNAKKMPEGLQVGMFLFNSPHGACSECYGKGVISDYDIKKVFPSEDSSIEEWHDVAYNYPKRKTEDKGHVIGRLDNFIKHYNISKDTPFSQLTEEQRDAFLNYSPPILPRNKRHMALFYFGIKDILKGRLRKIKSDFSDISIIKTCPKCNGYRIGEVARSVLINGKHIGELGKMNIQELGRFLREFESTSETSILTKRTLKEIYKRLKYLENVGLTYLNLHREVPSLSGGETQRLHIMGHLSSQIESIIYIFDEPTAGLHENEKEILIESFKKLKEQGNTVIIVEHDESVLKSAEYIIDFGPKAGVNGGEIVYQGDFENFLKCKNSLTAKYLKKKTIPAKKYKADTINEASKISIKDANKHNLINVNVDMPLNQIVGVCGVSGSGKSTLIMDTLIPNVTDILKQEEKIKTLDIDSLCVVDQKLASRSDASCVATFLGIWDNIRKIFAGTDEAISKNYDIGFFSFNSKGSCPKCNGAGYLRGWISDVFYSEVCPECNGKRFLNDVMTIYYKDKNISDILNMSITEAISFFNEQSGVVKKLQTLDELGMGYILLGQRLTTLSGGEAQRLKLARELSKYSKLRCLYILDEPTVGLSYYDTEKLLIILARLVENGHSVLIIEHDPYVLSFCDYLIEMGPGGGDKGGEVISIGTVDQIKSDNNSIMGKYLYRSN